MFGWLSGKKQTPLLVTDDGIGLLKQVVGGIARASEFNVTYEEPQLEEEGYEDDPDDRPSPRYHARLEQFHPGLVNRIWLSLMAWHLNVWKMDIVTEVRHDLIEQTIDGVCHKWEARCQTKLPHPTLTWHPLVEAKEMATHWRLGVTTSGTRGYVPKDRIVPLTIVHENLNQLLDQKIIRFFAEAGTIAAVDAEYNRLPIRPSERCVGDFKWQAVRGIVAGWLMRRSDLEDLITRWDEVIQAGLGPIPRVGYQRAYERWVEECFMPILEHVRSTTP